MGIDWTNLVIDLDSNERVIVITDRMNSVEWNGVIAFVVKRGPNAMLGVAVDIQCRDLVLATD